MHERKTPGAGIRLVTYPAHAGVMVLVSEALARELRVTVGELAEVVRDHAEEFRESVAIECQNGRVMRMQIGDPPVELRWMADLETPPSFVVVQPGEVAEGELALKALRHHLLGGAE